MAERRQQAGDPSDRAFPSGGVTLGADEMRALAHRAVDAIIHDLAEPAPIVRREPQAGLRARLDAPAPARGRGFDAALDQLFADVLPYRARYGSPGFLGFIPGYPNWVGALGDFIVSALNADAAWWVGAAGATQLELTVLGWFADWIGYPADASGILLGGGSAANLTALACARERRAGPMRDDLVVYVSSESHSSVARAARVLGFRPERVRVLPVDAAFRLSLPAFAATIDADRRRGLTPLAVCANAGTTNTGAVDPLGQLADLCGEADVWLHVDAAYGGFAVLTERGRRALAGIDRADSVALDPHKWLFQPVECGALLVREPDGLERAFAITPDYLRDITAQAGPNLSDRGLQLTRTSRAVKVWLSVQTFGLDAFRDAIDTAIDLARDAAAHVERSPALELLAPVDLGVVALRRHPPGEDDEERLAHLNEALVVEVERAANAIVSSTRLFGRTAIRLCVLNPTTTAADVARVLKVLEQAPVDLERAPAAPVERHVDVTGVGHGAADAAAGGSASLPAALAGARDALGNAREASARPGEVLIEQWSTGRDVLVVLDGVATVQHDRRLVARVGPGDVVGELAALDWGAGYGALRAARVQAETPVRYLVLAADAFAELMRTSPAVRDLVERSRRERQRPA